MKTLKLSLNALAALCCLTLFMTSCQDDAVENDVQPAAATDQELAAAAEQILTEDQVSTSTKDLLQALTKGVSSPQNLENARIGDRLVYDLTVVAGAPLPFPFFVNAADEPVVTEGTLELVEATSVVQDGFVIEADEGLVKEVYAGEFVFSNGESTPAAAVTRVESTISGNRRVVRRTTTLYLESVPGFPKSVFLQNRFKIGEDFSSFTGIFVNRGSAEPGSIGGDAGVLLVTVEGEFLETIPAE